MSKIKVNLPLEGSCQCGAIAYKISALPLTLYACHCTECQKQSSSSFGMSMLVLKEAFSVVSGVPKVWTRKAECGEVIECAFCVDCGSRLFHSPRGPNELISVKAGTLAHTKWLNPVGHIWVSSSQSGAISQEGKLTYAYQPESLELLIQAWNNQYEVSNI
jgi:hypothetical protein